MTRNTADRWYSGDHVTFHRFNDSNVEVVSFDLGISGLIVTREGRLFVQDWGEGCDEEGGRELSELPAGFPPVVFRDAIGFAGTGCYACMGRGFQSHDCPICGR